MRINPISISSKNETAGNVFPIVLSANDNFAPYAGTAIQSIILNADPDNIYRIFVLHNSISAKHVKQLEHMTTKNTTVQCINIDRLVSSIQTPLPLVVSISKEAYYRILIPEIEVLKSYPFVIYLDCDIIVDADIAGIVPQNMADNLIAAVRDHPMMRKADRLRLENDLSLDAAQYINSGVLVINIPQWIQEDITQKCFDFLNSVYTQKYIFMDQDIINVVCQNRIVYLDESWNYNWYWRYGDRETVEVCKAVTDRIGESFHILHFTTPMKPWYTMDHPYFRYFWKYAGQSPFSRRNHPNKFMQQG